MTLAKELTGSGVPPATAKAMGGQYSAITAAGSSQTDATAINVSMSVVAGADGTKGVILPAAEVGDDVTLFNNSGSTLKVYPDSGSAIAVAGTGLGSANAAFSQLTYKTTVYKKVTSTQWLAITTA